MKKSFALWLVVGARAVAQSPKIAARFGIDADLDRFPQPNAKDTLRTVLKAIEGKRVDYLLAHLAEPAFVDERVKQTGGKFDVMVKETTQKFDSDPESLRELRKFLTDGTWKDESDTSVSVTCPNVRGKMVFFKKIGDRWFLENRIKPGKES